MYETDMYKGMLAETVTIPGVNGELSHAYPARRLVRTMLAVLEKAEPGRFV